MKKFLQVLSILASAVVIISCKTTAQVAQNEQAVTVVKPINWQGAELGLQIPEWVLYVASQDYEALNNLPEAMEKRLLPSTGSGADKDLLKIWLDTQDASSKLSEELQQTVTSEASSRVSGNTSTEAGEASLRMAKKVTGVVSQTSFSGFSRLKTFWTQVQRPSDGKLEYNMYALYGIDKEILSKQIDDVLKQVNAESPDEEEALEDMERLVRASAAKVGVVVGRN